MIRRGIGVQSFVSAGGGTDADAQAFITAAGITDATQQSAINTLVTDLKTYGVWTKMKAIYPMVGGTSSTHKWNLKDPRDLDAAFRLVFSGGLTHNANGITGNGTNGFADTKLNDNTILNLNNVHCSVYLRTNTDGLRCDLGVYDGISGINIYSRYINSQYLRLHEEDTNTIATTDSRGFRLGSRNISTSKNIFINNTKTTFAQNSVSKANYNIYIMASNGVGSAVNYSNRECAFASIGDGLTDTEAANLYTAVQAYQTSLSRNV